MKFKFLKNKLFDGKIFARKRRGFTIVELLVSMTVFAILIGLISNIFIGSLRAQRRIMALMTANDNASLVLEQIARELRTGINFCIPIQQGNSWVCDPANPASGARLMFENAHGEQIVYRVNNEVIERRSDTEGRFLPITSEFNVRITRFGFLLEDKILGNGPWPPRITMIMQVGTKMERDALNGVFTDIQTTISAREF
ncbi:MAG: hypothetical protein COU07_01595 [Candidatus Harrisonbacteria bacterium CG10_big_fil_rev_8_21_14_0_10_40_38]|uniref:Prepilin-type N-terminal cleavage/methylation domain-containing protein n=1 Tax=Candidatus Harrisonbacteria bacterium CG10_big_fil_rev_8_21_14_0_10_40_38 TaxID=1974583 RepID=A0A2H0UT57_9BACT|nr:MAG: hypothetical protein COU07_01595 [Candidatus Harrisonbacteria bacterium CG10_big_fil_rev_8_21_14_0_10_40_38]